MNIIPIIFQLLLAFSPLSTRCQYIQKNNRRRDRSYPKLIGIAAFFFKQSIRQFIERKL